MSSSRSRVLDAAWDLVRREGAEALTMAAVARASGVSRQMVYLHFENRAGLFTAMARHHDERTGFVGQVRATFDLEPAAGLEALLRAWLAYVPVILPVARALQAAALTGADGGQAWHDRMRDLRSALRSAVERLELAPGWEPGDAADWLWSQVHTARWDQLVVECGGPAEVFVERTVGPSLDAVLARA